MIVFARLNRLENSLDQKLHLVTGKGGVGKSTVAAGLAMRLASRGEKTLLVELGERSFYASAWEGDFGFEAQKVSNNMWLSRWEAEDCLKEYLGHLIKVPKVAELFFENRVMKALVSSAPALRELAIMGKLTSGIRRVGPKFDYQHVVLDAYATGHFKALLNAAVGMNEAVGFGPMGEQTKQMIKVIKDTKITKIYTVALPEELPVKETLELGSFLQQQFSQIPLVIMNKSLRPHLEARELEKLSSELSEEKTSRENLKVVNHLHARSKEEDSAIDQLGEAVITVSNHFLPASEELFEKVGAQLQGGLTC